MAAYPKKSACTKHINRILVFIPLMLIKVYRYLISPLLGSHCRFYPTCSHYAESAFQDFGWYRGTLLTLKRIAKCHPWHSGGADPLPAKKDDGK